MHKMFKSKNIKMTDSLYSHNLLCKGMNPTPSTISVIAYQQRHGLWSIKKTQQEKKRNNLGLEEHHLPEEVESLINVMLIRMLCCLHKSSSSLFIYVFV